MNSKRAKCCPGEWMAFKLWCCVCIVQFLWCLSPGTSWFTHSGCITEQSNPDCKGLLACAHGPGRLYGWHTHIHWDTVRTLWAHPLYPCSDRLGPKHNVSDKYIPTNQKLFQSVLYDPLFQFQGCHYYAVQWQQFMYSQQNNCFISLINQWCVIHYKQDLYFLSTELSAWM